MENVLTLLCAKGIYGLHRYASMIAVRALGKVELANEANRVYNFKKHGANAAEVEAQIRAVAACFGCGEIVAVPGHTTEPNRLQQMFGAKLRRTAEVQSRKYSHKAEIDYREHAATLECDALDAQNLLVVDDVCTTGKTLEFYARYFRNRRKRTALLCVGLYHKMNPAESEHSIAWELPPAETPGSEALPDLPMENMTQFIGRMKRDYDLTNI